MTKKLTKKIKIVIAADHAGFALKELLLPQLTAYLVTDLGTNSTEAVDYPDYAYQLSDLIASAQAEIGILICGSGIGMSIAVNRNKKIRGALCYNEESARLARRHNNANVLILGARFVDYEQALACLNAFLTTKFEEDRHSKRVEKLS